MKISPLLSFVLDFLRWIAAFFVVVGHLRSLMFVSYDRVSPLNPFDSFFYFLTGFGHEAVIVFFSLSGYLVGGEFLRITYAKYNLIVYLIKRFSRIFIVFIPALIVGFILDTIGSNWLNYSDIYSGGYSLPAMNYDVSERLGVDVLISNLLMMQESLRPTLGSNGPLWSLANEWWYYTFPVLVLLSLKSKKIILKFISFFMIVFLVYILNIDIILYFSVWLLGMVATLVKVDQLKKNILYLSASFLVIALFSSRIKLNNCNIFIYDIFISVSVLFLLISIRNNISIVPCFIKINKLLADFSYSLYLFHFPFILILIAGYSYISPSIQIQPSIFSYSLFILIILITYIYSYIMYLFFESKTNVMKHKLIKCIK